MATTSAKNPNVVKTDLDSVFYQEWDYTKVRAGRATARTDSIFRQETWEMGAYQEEEMQGTGLWGETLESNTFNKDEVKFTNKLTTSIRKFTNGLDIPIEFFKDNLHGALKNAVKNYAINAKKSQDFQAFSLFRNAFTTQLTGDGQAFISASHPLKNGGTVSNLASGALSETTLDNAFTQLNELVDNNGILGMCEPAILLVPSKLFSSALKITKSVLEPGTGNNDLNYFSTEHQDLQVIGTPWIGSQVSGGSDTAWYLLADNHCITRLIREGITTSLRDWAESDNGVYKYKGYFREAYKVMNYIGAVASLGT